MSDVPKVAALGDKPATDESRVQRHTRCATTPPQFTNLFT